MSTAIIPIKITDKAIKEIKIILTDKEIPADYGLRVGMQGGGCGGVSFMLGFDKPKETDGVFEIDDFKVFIEKKDTMYLLGMVVDYIEQEGKKGFTFIKGK